MSELTEGECIQQEVAQLMDSVEDIEDIVGDMSDQQKCAVFTVVTSVLTLFPILRRELALNPAPPDHNRSLVAEFDRVWLLGALDEKGSTT